MLLAIVSLHLCDTKSSGKKYHLSKQSIRLWGAWGQKVRGNPCDYHFRSCQWQGATLSDYTAALDAAHILRRHLNCAPALHSDTLLNSLLIHSMMNKTLLAGSSPKLQHRNTEICIIFFFIFTKQCDMSYTWVVLKKVSISSTHLRASYRWIKVTPTISQKYFQAK